MVKTRKTFKCNLTIDGEKLLKEIEKRGLTKGEVAAEVGKSSSYINTCVADKSIAPPVMKLLDLLYNIKYEDIKPDSTGGGTDGTASGAAGLDMDELRKVIYQECRRAIEEALNE